jgi:hypothetical protein
MTRLKTFGAAAILSIMTATPVFAQAAMQEPGAFAFYHPNADVLKWRPADAGCSRGRHGSGTLWQRRRLCLRGRQRERLDLRSALPFLRSGIGYLPRL